MSLKQRPQSGVSRPGTAQVPKRNTSSAVPEVKNSTYDEYERFKKVFEMDAVYTISKELEETAQQEKQAEMNYMQGRQKAMESAQAKNTEDTVDRMLQIYFLLPHKPDPNAVEEKKDSPSK